MKIDSWTINLLRTRLCSFFEGKGETVDARFVNPFIASTADALRIMTGLEVARGSPFLSSSFQAMSDISGVIGLAGDARGTVVLSFPLRLAGRIYNAITGDVVPDSDPAIGDAVGEIANMVAGGAKGAMAELDVNFRISVPSVVFGPLHSETAKASVPCIVIPFQLGSDAFWVQVSLEPVRPGTAQ